MAVNPGFAPALDRDTWRVAERRSSAAWVENRPIERFDPQRLAMRGLDA